MLCLTQLLKVAAGTNRVPGAAGHHCLAAAAVGILLANTENSTGIQTALLHPGQLSVLL